MKLLSWNVNGIRSIEKKGFAKWFEDQKADFVCLQETKANPEQVSEYLKNPGGTHSYWSSAQKAGYSGVAVFAKKEPLSVREGLGIADIDSEGRVLTLEYPEFSLINAYFPNSQHSHARLPYKLTFNQAMLAHCEALRKKGKHIILCGDFNVAHTEIDLKNPKTNHENPGFLPEERAWMDAFVASEHSERSKRPAYIDTFRKFNPGAEGHYTWWSYRPGVRARNVGWRIDYFVTNPEFADRLKAAEHQTQVMGSDHCPVLLQLKK